MNCDRIFMYNSCLPYSFKTNTKYEYENEYETKVNSKSGPLLAPQSCTIRGGK